MQGSAKKLVKAALQEAARKREMRYSDLYKIDKKVRRHFHDDITVIVLFLNHDLISRGAVLNTPLTIRSALDHWLLWFVNMLLLYGCSGNCANSRKYTIGTLLEYTIHSAATYGYWYRDNLLMTHELVTLVRSLSMKMKKRKRKKKYQKSNFWLAICQIPCPYLHNAVIRRKCLI